MFCERRPCLFRLGPAVRLLHQPFVVEAGGALSTRSVGHVSYFSWPRCNDVQCFI